MATYVERRKSLINRLISQIHAEEVRLTNSNYVKFEEEVRNLLDCVGPGFCEGDYYAPRRYYSKIEGVKNIRFTKEYSDKKPSIIVKVVTPKGYMLPKEILGYKVIFTESSNFNGFLDY